MKKTLLPLFSILCLLSTVCAAQTPTPTPGITIVTVSITLAWDAPPASDNISKTLIYKKNGAAYSVVATVQQPANQVQVQAVSGDIYAASFVNSAALESRKTADLLIPAIPAAPNNFHFSVNFSVTGP